MEPRRQPLTRLSEEGPRLYTRARGTQQGHAMIVEQIWTANAGRNFNYLVACEETGEALAIDPLDHQKCLAATRAKGWTIRQILNTHEHRDHTGSNQQVIAATGALVLAHAN